MMVFRFWVLLCLAFTVTSGCAFSPKAGEGFRDVPYGKHERQVYDVYVPKNAAHAPVIFMVHGGAWRAGDKTNRAVVKHKVKRWLPKGVVIISTNYRLLPDADPVEQARDVARAIAHAQKNASQYGANPKQFILMGHSAGAHIISLLNADFSIAQSKGAQPWLGAVSIDFPEFNIEKLMQDDPAWFYRAAFGEHDVFWREASPYHRLEKRAAPLLAIYSTKRKDKPETQILAFAQHAQSLGLKVETLPVALSHTAANSELGKDNDYTVEVEAFLKRLDASFNSRL